MIYPLALVLIQEVLQLLPPALLLLLVLLQVPPAPEACSSIRLADQVNWVDVKHRVRLVAHGAFLYRLAEQNIMLLTWNL